MDQAQTKTQLNRIKTIAYAISEDALERLAEELDEASVRDLVSILSTTLKTGAQMAAMVEAMEAQQEKDPQKEGPVQLSPMAKKLAMRLPKP